MAILTRAELDRGRMHTPLPGIDHPFGGTNAHANATVDQQRQRVRGATLTVHQSGGGQVVVDIHLNHHRRRNQEAPITVLISPVYESFLFLLQSMSMNISLFRSPKFGSGVTMLVVASSVLVASCGSDKPDTNSDTKIGVVTAFYPLEEAARGVGGDLVTVTDLTPPGQGPHDLELQPAQMGVFETADVAIYLGRGFQPQVEDAIANAPDSLTRLDLLDEVDLLGVDAQLEGTDGEVDGEVLDGDVDPHVWLDPSRMIAMVEAITATFVEVDPDNAGAYRKNAEQYLTDLRGLDGEYRAALAECRSRVIVTSHRAFGYLANTYDLRQIPIAGISPDIEPDPRTMEAIAAEAKAEGVTTIFLESIAPPALAETVAREIGAELDLLDPIEGLTQDQLDAGKTYASIMRDNLQRLVTGLGCTE